MSQRTRNSAKQAITELANEMIKELETVSDDGIGIREELLRGQLFALQRVAIRMGWDVLERRIEKARKRPDLPAGATVDHTSDQS